MNPALFAGILKPFLDEGEVVRNFLVCVGATIPTHTKPQTGCERVNHGGVFVGYESIEATTSVVINIYGDPAFLAKVGRIVSSPRHQGFESMWGVAHP